MPEIPPLSRSLAPQPGTGAARPATAHAPEGSCEDSGAAGSRGGSAHGRPRPAAAAADTLEQRVRATFAPGGPLVLAGGLLLNQPRLEMAVRDSVGLPCVRLELPPVEGAVRLAGELLQR